MAYFSNGSEGWAFDMQCIKCKYGDRACPIAMIQMEYNYSACNVPVARQILDDLVKNDGTCAMYDFAKADFAIDPNQLKLDFGNSEPADERSVANQAK